MANTVYSASLIMTADVKQAKQSLQDLQKSLDSLMRTSHESSPLGLTQEIAKATSDVAGLKAALQSATNVNTGKLDLSKFSRGLDTAKLDIKQVASSLQSLGPAGQQAFSQLATSIMSAEVPLKQTNKLLNDFKTTLANTVKWQISSSMVNSLVGAMQHAYGYAQDLNKSLNDIRIVTGYSTDQMAKFAKEANNAARALSTTTTQYTDAALIYYQQGLAEKDIKARTDATIKMANVTGESAKAVSDYMTAIWNNFDNGSKSIEYYADVMTALGAATASSTDEIAAGLEKFAAVSETVGLSYEYATAALATVTAETRQSADVVGNAFKTLFSRIQGLNLGETMDDGTTLNKYSSALAKVGIDIKDTTGEIKTMDTILDELGTKWQTLSNDTQMALAQTVAGVRQYNQLISLMNNWDTFKINLGVAVDAEGTLQEQADIYAESWQAAADRVEAAFEDIYDSVLNDEFFIKLTDFFGGLIDVIGNTIDGIGGMSGAFAALGVVVTRAFGKDISDGLSSLFYDPNKALQQGQKLRKDTLESLGALTDEGNIEGSVRSQNYVREADWQSQIIAKQEELAQNGQELSQLEQLKLGYLTDQLKVLHEQELVSATIADNAKNNLDNSENDLNNILSNRKISINKGTSVKANDILTKYKDFSIERGVGNALFEKLNEVKNFSTKDFKDYALNLKNSIVNTTGVSLESLANSMKELDNLGKTSTIDDFFKALTKDIDNNLNKTLELRKQLNGVLNADEQAQLNNFSVQAITFGESQIDLGEQEKNVQEYLKRIMADLQGVKPKAASAAEGFMVLGDAISSCSFAITTILGLIDVWNNEDMTFGEKLLTTFTSIGMALPMLISGLSTQNLKTIQAIFSARQYEEVLEDVGDEALQTALKQKILKGETIELSDIMQAAGLKIKSTGSSLKGWGKELLTTLKSLTPLLLIIAGLAVIGGGIKIAVDSFNEANNDAENAIKNAQTLANEYENVKNSYEDFKNTASSYEDVVNSMSEMTKGTLEYNEALMQANELAMSLIDSQADLQYFIGNNGLINFKPGELERAQKVQLEQMGKIQASSLSSDVASSNLQGKAELINTARSTNSGSDTANYAHNAIGGGVTAGVGGALIGTGIGAAIGVKSGATLGTAILPGLGTLIGAAAGVILGAITGTIVSAVNGTSSKAEEMAIQTIAEHVEKTGNNGFFANKEAFEAKVLELGIDSSLIDALWANADAIEDYTKNEIARNKQEESKFKTAFNAANINNQDYINARNQEFIQNEAWKMAQEQENEIRQEVESKWDGMNEDFWEDYLKTIYDEENVDGEGQNYRVVDMDGGAVTIQQKDENGGWINLTEKNGLDEDVAEEQLIQAKLVEAAEKGIIEADKTFDDFAKQLESSGLKAGEDEEIIGRIINDWVDGLESTEIDASQLFEIDVSKISNKKLKDFVINSINEAKENLPDWYDVDFFKGLTEEQKTLLLKAHIDSSTTEQELLDQISRLQLLADQNAIYLRIQLNDQMIDAWKSGDLDTLKELFFKSDYADDDDANNEEEWINWLERLYTEGTSFLEEDRKQALTTSGEIDPQAVQAAGIEYDNAVSRQETAKQNLDTAEQKVEKEQADVDFLSNLYNSGNLFAQWETKSTATAPYDYHIKNDNDMENLLNYMVEHQVGGMNSEIKDNMLYNLANGDRSTVAMELATIKELFYTFFSEILSGEQREVTDAKEEVATAEGEVTTAEGEVTTAQSAYETAIAQQNANTYALRQEYGEEADWAFEQYNSQVEGIKAQGLPKEEEINQLNEAFDKLNENLKIVEKSKAEKILDSLGKTFEDLEKGTNEYNNAINDVIKQFNILNDSDLDINDAEVRALAEAWANAETEVERYEAAGKLALKATEDIDAENIKAEVDVTFADDELQTYLQQIRDDMSSNPVILKAIGEGDFATLVSQLYALYGDAEMVAIALASIGATELQGENFAKFANALALLEAGDFEGAKAALEECEDLFFNGEMPDYGSKMTGAGGGGGSGKSASDSLDDTIKKRRDRKRELLGLKQEGLDPEEASKYYQEEIEMIEEENKLLEEQIDMYKEQLPDAVEDFNSLVRSKGFGEFQLVLNDDGTIANLDAVLADLQARWDYAELMEDTDLQNNLDDIYNALMGPLGLQENIDENVALIAKNRKEQAQLALEDIVNRIDWRIKQIDYQIEKLNYYQEKLLIQAHGNKQTIEAMLEGFQYQEQEMLQLFEKGAALRQGIDELIAAKVQYPDYAQMFDEQILEYQQDLIDVNMDILELRAEMEELIQNVLELALDEMDIQNERIDRYVSMLDRFQNIIDLSGRSILDQSLKVELGVAKLDTLINKMSISKQTMEGLAEATKLAQEALEKRAAAGDETSVSFWENQVEMLEMELEKAQDDFLANWEEVLEAAADIFDMRVELTVQTLEQALSPFSSLSVLEDRYNKEKELQEKYLDDATKLYELNKLNRQLNQSITDENDLLAKSKLRDIQEEILAYQKAGVQMSQYDLDILQKKYDLRLAEIALMEAQNSKTSMRLIRDAAGNWTYAYDADQTAIDEALQAVEDATYELQKASTDYIDEMTKEMISIEREFVEAIGDLDRNSTDYTEQLLYLQQHYMKEYNVVLGEFQKGVENAGLTIHDTWYGATLDLYNFEDAQKHFSDASDLAISELMVNYKDWQKVVEQAMGVAGTSWESFGDDTGATLDSLEEHIQALCDEISKLVDVLMEYVATSIGMVEEWQSKYSKQVDAELARNEAYMEMPGHGGNAGSGGGGVSAASALEMAGGDYSLAMTLLVAANGQSALTSEEYQALATARQNKIDNDPNLSAEVGKSIINTDSLTEILKDTSKSEQALASDVIASADGKTEVNISYTQNNYQASQDNSYTSQSGILYDFINGMANQQGAGKGGRLANFISGYVPSPNSGNLKNYDYYNGVYNPRSGWCSKWVGDVFEYNGDDFIRGNAWDAVKRNGGTVYSGQYIANGTAVGSQSGEYGHIGIYQDGYIYATSSTGNSLDRYTISEWEKTYGQLYVTNATSSQSGQTAANVFTQENGNTYGRDLHSFITGVDNNIQLSSNSKSLDDFIKGFDTGGYTGTWGPYGRLALLHEKELVLNKTDTSNILDAVKISRGVDDKISNMIAFTNNSLRELLSFIKLPTFETQPIEQKVEIKAEFPGVTDQYEIQEALSNLSNDASQYLNIQRNFW